MHVNFELPDDLAQRLQAKWHDTLAHYARERLIMEAYRDELLASREVGEILGLDRFDVEALCKKYQISTYTLDDFNRDGETLKPGSFSFPV
jgi:hypothetical protein